MSGKMSDQSAKRITVISIVLAVFAGILSCSLPTTAEKMPTVELINDSGLPENVVIRHGLNIVAILRPECRDCVAELPVLKELAGKCSYLHTTLIIYGKNYDAIAEYKKKFAVSGALYFADPRKITRAAFDMHYLPFLIFVDGSGEILGEYENENGVYSYQELTDIVRQLGVNNTYSDAKS